MAGITGARVNTLGLDTKGLNRLLDVIDGDTPRESSDPRRRHLRVRYRLESVLTKIKHPNGVESLLRLPTRNLSSSGVGLLHNSYLHLGTRVALAMPDPEGGHKRVTGRVVRTQHLAGTVHEIGIRFDEEQRDLIRGLLSEDHTTSGSILESVDPSTLQGRILHIEDSKNDRAILRHHLRETQVAVVSCETFDEGLKEAMSSFDLIVLDFFLDNDRTGDELLLLLRGRGIHTPVMVLTADGSASTRGAVRSVRAEAMLTKPMDQMQLLQMLGEFLIVRKSEQACRSELTNDPAMAKLVRDFVAGMPKSIAALSEASTMNDYVAARRHCIELGNGAASLGFPKLAKLAAETATKLAASMSTEETQIDIQRVLTACRTVSAA